MARNKTAQEVKAKPRGRKPKAQIDQLKPAAQQLYLSGKTFAEISLLLGGVDDKYISKWCADGGWAAQRAVITTSKPALLKNLYAQCQEISNAIEQRSEGKRFADSKEGDTILKLTAAIKNLEGEANISQVVEVGISISDYVANYRPADLQLITDIFQGFLNIRLQNGNR